MLFLKAFVVGGLICVVGQLLIDLTKLTPAKILVSFVCLGVVLGGIGVYDKLIDFAGAGATLPLTGFGSALASGTRDAIREMLDIDGIPVTRKRLFGSSYGSAMCIGRRYNRCTFVGTRCQPCNKTKG